MSLPPTVWLVAATLLAATAQAAEPGLRVTACFEFEHTAVGNPASTHTTDCVAQQLTGPDPAGVFERQWTAISTAGDKATALWDAARKLGREKCYVTLALVRASLSVEGGATNRHLELPALGPDAVRYERVRVCLRDGSYGFDYYRRGGKGPQRLFDIGRPIGAP